MAENSSGAQKPLAFGQAKGVTLLKLMPDKVVLSILERYVKAKTGSKPRQVNTFLGIILETNYGKIFFKDGRLEFEPNPFAVKKVKNWLPEMKQVLQAYAGKIFMESVKKKLSEKYKVLRFQEINQGLILEVVDSQEEDKKFQVIVTPIGKVLIFAGSKETQNSVEKALEIVNFLQSEGLIDF